MDSFRFQIPIAVRYGDLDPQWHVNNSRFLTFCEQARFAYLLELKLFDGKSYDQLPLIVGDIHCKFLAPIEAGVTVIVWAGVTKIGNKSLVMSSKIASEDGKVTHAEIDTIMIGYDYSSKTSMPISDAFRTTIETFEGKKFPKPAR